MSAFDGWAVLELMGHRVRYGRVSEVTQFGVTMCRIDMPTDPPTFELYSGSAIYGIRPASEEAIRAYHAPRRALPSGEHVIDDDEFDADSGDQHDDDPDDEDDPETCAFCAEPLGTDPTERVDTGEDGDSEIWHRSCAEQHADQVSKRLDAEQPT
jgi:hypothetical protein